MPGTEAKGVQFHVAEGIQATRSSYNSNVWASGRRSWKKAHGILIQPYDRFSNPSSLIHDKPVDLGSE
jgi:hypothetical protein